MSDTEEQRPPFRWIHVIVQVIVAGYCVYWRYWQLPPPNKAVLLLAGVAAIMALWEMRPIHKAAYFLLILFLIIIENRAIDHDRKDFAEAEESRRVEERQQFSHIGTSITDNVQKLLDNSDDKFRQTLAQQSTHFDATMQKFGTVTNMQRLQLTKENELIDLPSAITSCRELADRAQEVSTRMRARQSDYMLEDQRIDLPIWNEMTMPHQTQAHIDELAREDKKKRAELLKRSEAAAMPTIAIANKIRKEMVRRLLIQYKKPEDDTRAEWFERTEAPALPTGSLYDNAAYLDDLTKRMMFSCIAP